MLENHKAVCEECQYAYTVSRNWTDERLCPTCRREVTRAIGEPAYDCAPTPEELDYVAQSLGLEKIDDPDQLAYAPFCNSCVSHGANRQDYPCLRKVCAWAMRPTQPTGGIGNYYSASANTTWITSTSTTTGALYNNNGVRYYIR